MSSVAEKLQRKSQRQVAVKQVRLKLVYVDFWSAVKLSFLVAASLGIVLVVASIFVWIILNSTGIFGSLDNIMKDILGDPTAVPTVERIQEVVAERFHLRVSEIKARSNAKSVTVPRQIAMYLAKTLLDTSYPELGRRFGGKHHSTVIHSVRKVEAQMARDASFRGLVHSLRDSLR